MFSPVKCEEMEHSKEGRTDQGSRYMQSHRECAMHGRRRGNLEFATFIRFLA